jgi:hypothetical protein
MKRAVRNLLCCVALPCLAFGEVAGSADAADLDLKAPYATVFTWAGFYAGVHVGYIWNDPELVASSIGTAR